MFSQQTLDEVKSKLDIMRNNDSKMQVRTIPYEDILIKKTYFAGPWFTDKDMEVMKYCEEVSDLLANNKLSSIYFPRQHQYSTPQETYFSNCERIEDCDEVLVLIQTKDVGTAFEVGYAKALGKNVVFVLYDEDCLKSKTNIMLAYGHQCILLSDLMAYLNGYAVNTYFYSNNWEDKE